MFWLMRLIGLSREGYVLIGMILGKCIDIIERSMTVQSEETILRDLV